MTIDAPVSEEEYAAFLTGDRRLADFDHAQHVRMGHAVLRRHDFLDAAGRYAGALRAMLGRIDRHDAFSVTTTIAFLSLIAERLERHQDWQAFRATNPDLLDKGALARHYSAQRLSDPRARSAFLLPDRVATADAISRNDR